MRQNSQISEWAKQSNNTVSFITDSNGRLQLLPKKDCEKRSTCACSVDVNGSDVRWDWFGERVESARRQGHSERHVDSQSDLLQSRNG